MFPLPHLIWKHKVLPVALAMALVSNAFPLIGQEAKTDATAAIPEEVAELTALYEKAMAGANEPLAQLKESYRSRLGELLTKTQESGNLDGLVAIKEDFEISAKGEPGEGSPFAPLADLQRIYHENHQAIDVRILPERIRIEQTYGEGLGKLVTEFTRKGEVESALATQVLLKASEARLDEWDRMNVESKGRRPETGRLDWAKLAHQIASGSVEDLQFVGGGNEFRSRDRDVPQETAILIGFEVFLNPFGDSDKTVRGVIPIFQTESGKSLQGKPRANTKTGNSRRVVAKRGYAVGAITAASERAIRKLKITFYRIDGFGTDPKDSYDSPWMGEWEGGKELSVGTGGLLPVGVDGFYGLGLDQLAIIVAKP